MSTSTRVLMICLLIASATTMFYGQGAGTGTILGTVTDSSGAVVANARVDITDIATGVSAHTQTTSAGDFTIPFLIVGTYRVTVQAAGFQKGVVDNIALNVAQQARANVTLKAGAISETVEVQAGAVVLDTDSSAVSQTVTEKQVDQLPLNGRNFLNLLYITPGAVQTGGEQATFRQGVGNAISISGGRPESNNYMLDGLVNTDSALNTPAVILSQDAIQEFKILSENYSAEYGYSANQVAIVSKSGSNEIHGAAFEFFRNNFLDASTPTPLSNAAARRPELRQNQFGFVLGGPVYIPKLYDGRNKTFWLANYEGWRIVNGYTLEGVVPTPAELTGDFSALGLTPFSTTPGSPCVTGLSQSIALPCAPGDPQTGAAFSGPIPTSRFSRLAQLEIAAGVFATPTPACVANSAACGGGINNFAQTFGLPETTNQQTYRLDQELGRAGKVFFRYTRSTFNNADPQAPYINPLWSLNTFDQTSTSWTVSHTIALGTRNINNFRFGYLHPIAIQGAPGITNSQISALGLTGAFTTLPRYAAGIPTLTFNGGATDTPNSPSTGATGSPVNTPTTSDIPTWEFADSMTMIRGKHTIGIGVDYRHFVEARNLATNYLGGYTYTNNLVLNNNGGCPTAFCGTGNSFADFLLGYYSAAATFTPGPFSKAGVPGNLHHYVFNYFAPYVQDDWKVSNRLTLNLGLRWDWRNVPYEESNDMFWFDDQNMPGGSRFTGGGLCFANKALLTDGVAPAPNNFYNYCGRKNPADSSKTPFAPRFGFAYQPFASGKTVIRGGYGIFWDSAEAREIDDSGDFYPYIERASLNPTTQSVAVAPKLTDQLFPPNTTLAPVSAGLFGSQFVAVVISDHPRNPYVQQFTLSVQHELARNTTLEVNYIGNRAIHLLDRINVNTPPPLTGAQLSTCQAAFNAGDVATYNANVCGWLLREPLRNFGPPGALNSSWSGYSNYNAGNIKLEHRSGDLTLLTVYTYAKSLDDKSAAAGIGAAGAGFAGHEDDLNPRLDYAPSDFNVKHRFVNSVVYALPIGRGKHFGSGMNRAEDLLIGGWQLSAITTFQTGFPFSITANDLGLAGDNSSDSFAMRANLSGTPQETKNIHQWFNTAAFSQPAFGVYGNSGRNIFTQPGINNWDVGLGKMFRFTERAGLQLRLETFNTFNHTQYGADPNQPGVVNGTSSVSASVNSPTFGEVTLARPGRVVQLGGKIVF